VRSIPIDAIPWTEMEKKDCGCHYDCAGGFFYIRCPSSSGVSIFLFSMSLFWWGIDFFVFDVSLLVGYRFFCFRCLSSNGVVIFFAFDVSLLVGYRFFCFRCLSSNGVVIFFAFGISPLVGYRFFCIRCLSSSGVSIFLYSMSLF